MDSGFGTRYSLPFFLVRVFHCSFHQHLRFLLQPLDGHHAEVFVEQRLAGLNRFLGLRVLFECCVLLAELPLSHRQQQPVEGVAVLAQIHRLLDRVGCILPLVAAVLGQPKVDQHVARFEVAVNDSLLMGVLNPWQMSMKIARRLLVVSSFWSQYSVTGMPRT